MLTDIAEKRSFLFFNMNKLAYPYRFHSIAQRYQNQSRIHALGKSRTIHLFDRPNFWVAQRVHRLAAN